MQLQIVQFDNFAVEQFVELIPEESNCGKRKKPGAKEPKNMNSIDYGLSFVRCNLTTLTGFQELIDSAIWVPDRLVYVNLSNNKLVSMAGIEGLKNLRILYLQGNKLNNIAEVKLLQSLNQLHTLYLTGNPLCIVSQYRCFVINTLQTLKKLDGNSITQNERETANNMRNLKAIKLSQPVLKVE